jgi:hypothetical protein
LTKPGSKSGELQRAILKRLREHEQQPDGLPTSTRFIFYELVAAGIIDKKNKEGGTPILRRQLHLAKGRRRIGDAIKKTLRTRAIPATRQTEIVMISRSARNRPRPAAVAVIQMV